MDIKTLLDSKVEEYNNPGFIEKDPIQIPHQFDSKGDIEISAFLTAIIAWGNKVSILNNAHRMMDLMDHSPYDYILNHQASDLRNMEGFVHRTFNSTDLITFITGLKLLYLNHQGLEGVFTKYKEPDNLQTAIHKLKEIFFQVPHMKRSLKHLPDPLKGSAAKRINMFLRWMVRKDNNGVDFGIWNTIPPAALSCPLDVHSGNTARKLGLLKRKQNDARAVYELDQSLRSLDPEDPVKYDFALYGMGAFERA